jgi:hypothetical protein
MPFSKANEVLSKYRNPDGGTHFAVLISRDRFEECIDLLRYTDRGQ